MTRPTDPTSRAVDVDWDAPELQELLKKTEGLRLDNRNTFHARWVRLHQGWLLANANVPWQPALLVWDDHQGGAGPADAHRDRPGRGASRCRSGPGWVEPSGGF